jgi:hypothetical protein
VKPSERILDGLQAHRALDAAVRASIYQALEILALSISPQDFHLAQPDERCGHAYSKPGCDPNKDSEVNFRVALSIHPRAQGLVRRQELAGECVRLLLKGLVATSVHLCNSINDRRVV